MSDFVMGLLVGSVGIIAIEGVCIFVAVMLLQARDQREIDKRKDRSKSPTDES